MKVTILQTDIEWGSPLENIKRAEALMAKQPEADLYVLPECGPQASPPNRKALPRKKPHQPR